MKGTTVRRLAWAGALVIAGASIGPVAAQEVSPSGEPNTVQTTRTVERENNDFPWGLLGLLGLGGLAGLRRREQPQLERTGQTEGAKTYTQR